MLRTRVSINLMMACDSMKQKKNIISHLRIQQIIIFNYCAYLRETITMKHYMDFQCNGYCMKKWISFWNFFCAANFHHVSERTYKLSPIDMIAFDKAIINTCSILLVSRNVCRRYIPSFSPTIFRFDRLL